MPQTCDDCGEEFATLSGLRLHDCPEEESTAGEDMPEERREDIRKQKRETERRVKRAASDDLTEPLEQARQGNEMAVHETLA